MLLPLGILASSGGGAADFQLISTQVLGSSAASVTFSSIPSTFRHLQVRAVTRKNTAGNGASYVQLNADSDANNYTFHRLYGNGSSALSDGSGTGSYTGLFSANVPGSDATANAFSAAIVDVLDYGQTSKYKTMRSLNGTNHSATIAALNSSVWLNTATVSSLVLSCGGSFATGSRFSLYGWN